MMHLKWFLKFSTKSTNPKSLPTLLSRSFGNAIINIFFPFFNDLWLSGSANNSKKLLLQSQQQFHMPHNDKAQERSSLNQCWTLQTS